MFPFKTLIQIDHNSSNAYYRQIAAQFIELIRQGHLQGGTPIPSSRALATLLGVHRKTIIAAYDELYAQSWIESLPRKGTRIAVNLPLVKPSFLKSGSRQSAYSTEASFPFTRLDTKKMNFPEVMPGNLVVNDGFPDPDLAPYDLMLKAYRKQLNSVSLKQRITMGNAGGNMALRISSCRFLNETRGLGIRPDQIMITRGAQMAIYLAAALVLKPGDRVLVSEPSYFIANDLFRSLGATLVTIPVDEYGMDVDGIEKMLAETKINLLYVIPHHHHPTTVSLSTSRRIKLLQLIKTHQLPVIEDDYDYDFHYQNSPILPLASADHGGFVIYIGSYTKLLAPSFRMGYLVAPSNFIEEAIARRRLIDLKGDEMMEEALAALLENGEMTRHIKRSVKLYNARCDLAAQVLKERLGKFSDFKKPQGGMAIWLRFKPDYSLKIILENCAKKGLILTGSAHVLEEPGQYNAIRFGFASLDEKKLLKAVEILYEVLSEMQDHQHPGERK